MVVKEYIMTRSDGVKLFKNYSDAGYILLQVETGAKYGEAIDIEGAPYTYEETDELIETGEDEIESTEYDEKAQAYDIITGVAE